MKYSVLLPFYNRTEQFSHSLLSYPQRDDIEILLGVDSKCKDIEKEAIEILHKTTDRDFKLIHVDNQGLNPVIIFNRLSEAAQGTFYIISNPETIVNPNVFNGLDRAFESNPDSYVVCAVRGVTMWLQHSVHRNRKLHFLSALSAHNYNKVGGFDEEYSKGISYDDDDFIHTIEYNGIPVVVRDDLVGFHQDHDRDYIGQNLELVNRNREYFINKWCWL